MSWDPRTWFSSSTPTATLPPPTEPAPTGTPFGARRRKTRRGGRKSRRSRTGKKSNR